MSFSSFFLSFIWPLFAVIFIRFILKYSVSTVQLVYNTQPIDLTSIRFVLISRHGYRLYDASVNCFASVHTRPCICMLSMHSVAVAVAIERRIFTLSVCRCAVSAQDFNDAKHTSHILNMLRNSRILSNSKQTLKSGKSDRIGSY